MPKYASAFLLRDFYRTALDFQIKTMEDDDKNRPFLIIIFVVVDVVEINK